MVCEPFKISATTETLLRVAVAGCFIGHGIVAIQSSGNFVSAWSGWIMSLFSDDIRYDASRVILSSVGAIDILVAVCLLLPEIPEAAYFWTVLWGFATATSRLYFLGRFALPFNYNVIMPLSEFLIRGANWICPLMLFVSHFGSRWFPGGKNISFTGCLKLFSVMMAGALSLKYIAELHVHAYQFELEKKSMPLWYFHGQGLAALVALTLWATTIKFPKAISAAVYLTAGTYVAAEAFEIINQNSPHGIVFTTVRLMEHFAVYAAIHLSLKHLKPRLAAGQIRVSPNH